MGCPPIFPFSPQDWGSQRGFTKLLSDASPRNIGASASGGLAHSPFWKGGYRGITKPLRFLFGFRNSDLVLIYGDVWFDRGVAVRSCKPRCHLTRKTDGKKSNWRKRIRPSCLTRQLRPPRPLLDGLGIGRRNVEVLRSRCR